MPQDLTPAQFQQIIATMAQRTAAERAQDAVTIAELEVRLAAANARLAELEGQEAGK